MATLVVVSLRALLLSHDPVKKMSFMKAIGVSGAQKILVSEYFVMNCMHSCMTWAISTRTSFVALIFDEDLFPRMTS